MSINVVICIANVVVIAWHKSSFHLRYDQRNDLRISDEVYWFQLWVGEFFLVSCQGYLLCVVRGVVSGVGGVVSGVGGVVSDVDGVVSGVGWVVSGTCSDVGSEV